jgi:hypothetical protein
MFSKEACQNIWYDIQKSQKGSEKAGQLQSREWDRVMWRER